MLELDFTTVSRAYTETQSRGLIESHVGRGTVFRARPVAAGTVSDPRRAREQDLAMNRPPQPDDPAPLVALRQLAMAPVTRWIEDGTADRIRRLIRAESAARQEIARRLLHGCEFQADPHAFNIWLS